MSNLIHSILIGVVWFTAPVVAGAGQPVVVTAKPRFEQRGDFVDLIVGNASHSFDISWAMPPKIQLVPLSLDTNQVYTFTVEEKQYREIIIPELRRVELKGQTIYDIEMCEVHKVKMESKEVRIAYSFPAPQTDAPSADTEQQLFPHRREYSLKKGGGCLTSAAQFISLGGRVLTPDSPKTEKVYVCSKCKEALEWWSGTATAPFSVLPRDTRYDSDQHLRLIYLEAYGKGYVDAWARKEALPVFSPTSDDDTARVFGYADGAAIGHTARDAWSGANGLRYGPTNSMSPSK